MQRPPRAGEPLAFVDTRIPQNGKKRNGIIPGGAVFFADLFQKDALFEGEIYTFLISCTDYKNVTKKNRVNYTKIYKNDVDKTCPNLYCIEEGKNNFTWERSALS